VTWPRSRSTRQVAALPEKFGGTLVEIWDMTSAAMPSPVPSAINRQNSGSPQMQKKPLRFSGLQTSVDSTGSQWKITGGADGTRTLRSPRGISKLLIHLRWNPLLSPSIPGFASRFASSVWPSRVHSQRVL
jgi:hypothetical protein